MTLQGQVLAIRLVENMSRTAREPTEKERQEIKKYGHTYLPDRYSYQRTGMLKLGVIGDYSTELQELVADGKQRRVKQRLNEFVVDALDGTGFPFKEMTRLDLYLKQFRHLMQNSSAATPKVFPQLLAALR